MGRYFKCRTVRPACDRRRIGCGLRVGNTAARQWRSLTPVMTSDDLLPPREAARRLGITVTTLYDWLGQSDRGVLVVRGRPVTVNYLQGGPRGQGRIRIEVSEIERLKDLMRVRPEPIRVRRPPLRLDRFPGITVPLGRPEA